MKFSFFNSVKGGKGQPCTWETFLNATESQEIARKAKTIAKGLSNAGELKATLPAVTWQAFFPDGERKNEKAVPSGLFMLDIDHIDNPNKIYIEKISGRLKELGIRLVHITISTRGLRLVADCNPAFRTLEENQRWLAGELGLEYDGVCKDFARCSFLVPFQYMLHIDGTIFDPQTLPAFVLQNNGTQTAPPHPVTSTQETSVQQVTQETYKGLPLGEIAMNWLKAQGGLPEEGERNAKLYKLALRMRYITDFNANTIAKYIPSCGLDKAEIMQLAQSACSGQRAGDMPTDMQRVIERMLIDSKNENEESEPQDVSDSKIDTDYTPKLPPIFEQYFNIAPDDFKQATMLCLLPILGTLGSKLRGRYLNDRLETPSFMVALEAPQASGKSFIEVLTAQCLKPLIEKDESEREKERKFEEEIKAIKLQGAKNTKGERQAIKELIENRPIPLIRKMPATASITKLLIRMEQAQGLHLFALAVEIDTVTKAFKRGFSNLSDLLRCSFDNSEFGQDYASETSYSGSVKIYYNTLYSGTPAAMRRFYNNSEDGTMSRTLFVTLPDQFGKKLPIWGKFLDNEQMIVDTSITKLYESSVEEDEVKDEHVMDMEYLNTALADWIEQQRVVSVKYNDRTRNTFYRRCAEVGFRAGLIAHYLYDEPTSKQKHLRNRVVDFSIWVANMMLKQFMYRIVLPDDTTLNLFASSVYNALPEEFTREQLIAELEREHMKSEPRVVLARWKQAGRILGNAKYGASNFKKITNEKN